MNLLAIAAAAVRWLGFFRRRCRAARFEGCLSSALGSHARHIPRFAWAHCSGYRQRRSFHLRNQFALDRHSRLPDSFSSGRRRHQSLAGLLTTLLLPIAVWISESMIEERQKELLCPPAAFRIWSDRCLHRARSVCLLHLLGSGAGAHVPDGRRLGQRPARTRGCQVLRLHHVRLRADAGLHHLSALA